MQFTYNCNLHTILEEALSFILEIWAVEECLVDLVALQQSQIGISESRELWPESAVRNFTTITGKVCNFIKRDSKTGVFPMNIVKFLETAFVIEHLRWLLLYGEVYVHAYGLRLRAAW